MKCNLCGKDFDLWDKQENFGFDYYVGYGSKYDLQHITVHFCCKCFDQLLDELTPRMVIPMESSELRLATELKPEEVAATFQDAIDEKPLKPGDRVIMNDTYYVPDQYKDKVWTVISEPWNLCGTWVVMLDGVHGGYAVDGLTKVEE